MELKKNAQMKVEYLAPYLPYGLKINTAEEELISIDVEHKLVETKSRGSLINIYELSEVKPILRPLSDLTDRINPVQHYTYLGGLSYSKIEFVEKVICNETLFLCDYNYLIEYHFDIFGLIDKGLAKDINEFKEL